MLEKINSYIEKGLISEQKHPEDENVRIYNYTQKCQFEGAWDEVTTKCRGLIFNIKTGKQLSNPFPKFFNYEEHVEKGWSIPASPPVVYDKYDGSLGILYWLNDKPWIATRGSFTSEQALWATEWFRNNLKANYFGRSVSYLFEIIYPENRIVVNYDFSGLVYIGARIIENGQDVYEFYNPKITKDLVSSYGAPAGTIMRRAGQRKDIFAYAKDVVGLRTLDSTNREGFVLFWPKENFRLKIKFDEYKRLHRIVTGLSAIGIWEELKEGRAISFENVPDEFFKWVESVQNSLRAKFAAIWGEAQLASQMVMGFKTRKEQALWILKEKKHISGIIFSLAQGQDKKAVEQVWKMVRPKGNVVYKVDEN